jgi:hypothetical protein
MKDFVKELAVEIRQTLTGERPEIVELRSKSILLSMVILMEKKNILSLEKCVEISKEIDELYK